MFLFFTVPVLQRFNLLSRKIAWLRHFHVHRIVQKHSELHAGAEVLAAKRTRRISHDDLFAAMDVQEVVGFTVENHDLVVGLELLQAHRAVLFPVNGLLANSLVLILFIELFERGLHEEIKVALLFVAV